MHAVDRPKIGKVLDESLVGRHRVFLVSRQGPVSHRNLVVLELWVKSRRRRKNKNAWNSYLIGRMDGPDGGLRIIEDVSKNHLSPPDAEALQGLLPRLEAMALVETVSRR